MTPHLAIAVLMWALGAAGCAFSKIDADNVHWTVPGKEYIGFETSSETPIESHSVTYRGTWQTEAYTRILGMGLDAELYLSFTPLHKTVSLDYSYTLEDFVESWSFNKGRPKVWLSQNRFYRRPASFFYRRYRLPGANRECVGYTASWRPKADDPKFRPSRLSFGYICLAAGIPMTAEHAKALLHRIEISVPSGTDRADREQRAAPAVVYDLCPETGSPSGRGALEYAQGTPACGAIGNPLFPFRFALYYNISDGRLGM